MYRPARSVAVATEGVFSCWRFLDAWCSTNWDTLLTGRHFGVQTRDITLLPIGGVARLESIPEIPMQEFWIAVAGPAVNVVIAAVLFVFLAIAATIESGPQCDPAWRTVLGAADGRQHHARLVQLAARLSDGRRPRAAGSPGLADVACAGDAYWPLRWASSMAILFGIAGVFSGQWMLVFIAIFVYLGAQAESHMVEMRSLLKVFVPGTP